MKSLSLFFLLYINLFACATCQLMTPMAELSLKLDIKEKALQKIHIEWLFSDLYSNEILIQYDKNSNIVLDPSELKTILNAKLDYLVPKKMLTKITYSKDDVNESAITPTYSNFDLKMVNKFLVFSYDATLNQKIDDRSVLSFLFEDDQNYFSFMINNIKVENSELFYEQNLYLHTASLYFTYQQPQKKEIIAPKKIDVTPTQSVDQNITQESLLKQSITKIKTLFEEIKSDQNPLSYALLLIFAYLYGVIHAIGPGHGKTLVGSYFLTNERSYSKALFVSLMIGIVHTFSAFLLTLIIYFFINQFLAQFLNDTIYYTTKVSALIIIAIALYLIYKKYSAYKKISELKQKSYTFSTTPHIATCSCNSCKSDHNSTDIALIISAGIIPCPGTVTLFIFSLSLGLYYVGFLSAFVMSLGMSTIIFISAMISVMVRKKTSDEYKNLKRLLEYGSLVGILVLGIFLFLA